MNLQMKTKTTFSLLTIAILAATTLSIAADAPTSPDAWQRDLLSWREKRATALQAPEGWLSLIGLEWLKEGDNSVGSAPDNKIQIAKAPRSPRCYSPGKGQAEHPVLRPADFPKSFSSTAIQRRNMPCWRTTTRTLRS